MHELVVASTRLTHTDPKAEFGALAVALAAYLSSLKSHVSPQDYYYALQNFLGEEATEFLKLIKKACNSVNSQETTELFAKKLGLDMGVSGYIYHTVPVVIHAWLRHPKNYQKAILEVVRCGGDTDTTAAILGGIIGAYVGQEGIPKLWLETLWEWPRTIKWIKLLAKNLADANNQEFLCPSLSLPAYGVFLRNIFFLVIVIIHGFRRLLPPY